MTDQRKENEPNEFGFAGAATAPEPQRDHGSPGHKEAENIAVPAGDLTGATSEAVEEATERDR